MSEGHPDLFDGAAAVLFLLSSYDSVPVRKIFSPNIPSAEITELDPYTVYNVSVVAIDGYGLPFQSTFLLARTNEGDCGSVKTNTLRSPGYPNNYPNDMNCVYRVPIPFDKYLVIYFNYFSLESHSNCVWDYLRISDGSNRIVGTYCGYQTGKRISVVGSIAVLKFHTDGFVRYRGFYLSFSFSPRSRVCEFENGLCPGWYQSQTDDFNWLRRSGRTPSYYTGPSSGYGGHTMSFLK